MENVTFNEEDYSGTFKSRKILGNPETPRVLSMLIKLKIAKDEKSAGIILLSTIILSVITSIILIIYINRPVKLEYNIAPEILQSLPTESQNIIYESQKK